MLTTSSCVSVYMNQEYCTLGYSVTSISESKVASANLNSWTQMNFDHGLLDRSDL